VANDHRVKAARIAPQGRVDPAIAEAISRGLLGVTGTLNVELAIFIHTSAASAMRP
jgi:hypothetical protein